MLERVDPDLRPYLRDLLDWLFDDWTSCSTLDGMAQQRGHEPSEAREVGLAVIAVGFDNDWFVPGELKPRFVQWEGGPTGWLERIASAWPVGRYLEIGEVCWFDLTDSGKAVATAVLDERYGPDAV